MSEKRFKPYSVSTTDGDGFVIGIQKEDGTVMSITDASEMLNEQQDTIITLKTRLEKINGGYGHLTHRNGLTANEWLIQSQEKELKKKDEQISRWIEQHSKDIAKISEQNKLIQTFKEENDQLRKIGVMYQGHNPCENCTYSLDNKVCCGLYPPISCDDAKENFVQGLCKKHKRFLTDDEVVALLNKQQATIQQLQREIEEWKKENMELLDQIQEFERIPNSIRELWVE